MPAPAVRAMLAVALWSTPALFAQMLPRPGTLVIRSVPTGAPVSLNGSTSSQQTDLSLAVSPGSYTVVVGNPGGKPFCPPKQLAVKAGQTLVLVCTESGWAN